MNLEEVYYKSVRNDNLSELAKISIIPPDSINHTVGKYYLLYCVTSRAHTNAGADCNRNFLVIAFYQILESKYWTSLACNNLPGQKES